MTALESYLRNGLKNPTWSGSTADFELVTWVLGLLAYPGITDLISIMKREFGFGVNRQSYFLGPATSKLIMMINVIPPHLLYEANIGSSRALRDLLHSFLNNEGGTVTQYL